MLIKNLKDSEESLRTTLLGFKEKKKTQGPSSYKSWHLPGGGKTSLAVCKYMAERGEK